MPNKIKYPIPPLSGLTDSQLKNIFYPGSIRIKNFVLGVKNVDFGPTSTTDYWNGITPPISGYTIYCNKATQGPSIFTSDNDSSFIDLAKILGKEGGNVPSILKSFIEPYTDIICVNKDYPNIVTDGLIALYDTKFVPSYPRTGFNFYDLSYNSSKSELSPQGTVIYDSVKSDLYFSGTSYINLGNTMNGDFSKGFSICVNLKFDPLNYENKEIIMELSNCNEEDKITLYKEASTNDLYFQVYSSGNLLGEVVFTGVTIHGGYRLYGVTLNGESVKMFSGGMERVDEFFVNLQPKTTKRDCLYFGKTFQDNYYFNGNLDTIMVYEKKLSDVEIETIRNLFK